MSILPNVLFKFYKDRNIFRKQLGLLIETHKDSKPIIKNKQKEDIEIKKMKE